MEGCKTRLVSLMLGHLETWKAGCRNDGVGVACNLLFELPGRQVKSWLVTFKQLDFCPEMVMGECHLWASTFHSIWAKTKGE